MIRMLCLILLYSFLNIFFAQYTKLYESIENNLLDKEGTILIRITRLFVTFFAYRKHRNHGKSAKRLSCLDLPLCLELALKSLGYKLPYITGCIHTLNLFIGPESPTTDLKSTLAGLIPALSQHRMRSDAYRE